MYIDAGNKNNALVIPVGIAFENAYKVKPVLRYINHLMEVIQAY